MSLLLPNHISLWVYIEQLYTYISGNISRTPIINYLQNMLGCFDFVFLKSYCHYFFF